MNHPGDTVAERCRERSIKVAWTFTEPHQSLAILIAAQPEAATAVFPDPGIHDRQERDLLSGGLESPGHVERNDGAFTHPAEVVRAVGLPHLHGLYVLNRHQLVLRVGVGTGGELRTSTPEGVDRLVRSHVLGERAVSEE